MLAGDRQFQDIKRQELSYYATCGGRPEKPADAENIGILDPFWEFVEKRWDREKTRRPRIQEVVEGVGSAAAHWRTAVPPGSAGQQEDSSVEGESGGLDEREFSLYVVSFALELLCSRDFSTLCQ